MQEATVVQAVRVRLVGRDQPLDYNGTLACAQYLRQRYPELNREEQPSLYSECRFSRNLLSEEDASQSVVVNVQNESSPSVEACRLAVLDLMNHEVHQHPGSLSRLGWRLDVLYALDGNDCVTWIVFSSTHTAVDGVSCHVVLQDFLASYSKLLEQDGDELGPPRERLPLYSALPRAHLPLRWSSRVVYGILGWLASHVMEMPGAPSPVLLTESATLQARKAKEERQLAGISQFEGPYHVDFIEIDASTAITLRKVARSLGLTVGSLVQAALFFAVAKRFFQEHPEASSLKMNLPMSVNMRPHLLPPLPNNVLAPQQGGLDVELKTTRAAVKDATNNDKHLLTLLQSIAGDARKQVKAAFEKPENLTPMNNDILLASLFRNGLDRVRNIQYIGDVWLSNVGVFKPPTMDSIKVETTLTLNPTIVPSYELVWCNTVAGGNMTVSIVVDETMGRNKSSATAFLEEVQSSLELLSRF